MPRDLTDIQRWQWASITSGVAALVSLVAGLYVEAQRDDSLQKGLEFDAHRYAEALRVINFLCSVSTILSFITLSICLDYLTKAPLPTPPNRETPTSTNSKCIDL